MTHPNFNNFIFDIEKNCFCFCFSCYSLLAMSTRDFSCSFLSWSYFINRYDIIIQKTSQSLYIIMLLYILFYLSKIPILIPFVSSTSIQLTSLCFSQQQLTLVTTRLCSEIFIHLDFQEFTFSGTFSFSNNGFFWVSFCHSTYSNISSMKTLDTHGCQSSNQNLISFSPIFPLWQI